LFKKVLLIRRQIANAIPKIPSYHYLLKPKERAQKPSLSEFYD